MDFVIVSWVSHNFITPSWRTHVSSNVSRGFNQMVSPNLLLMVQKSAYHHLRLAVHPILYRVFYIPGGCLGFLPWTALIIDTITSIFASKVRGNLFPIFANPALWMLFRTVPMLQVRDFHSCEINQRHLSIVQKQVWPSMKSWLFHNKILI